MVPGMTRGKRDTVLKFRFVRPHHLAVAPSARSFTLTL